MDSIDALNQLLTRNYDAEKGFQKAAEMTKNGVLKEYFQETSKMHYNFGHELKAEIKKIGGSPDKGSSLQADAHRGWMDIKAFLSSDSEEAIVEECKRGQMAAKEDYENTMKALGEEYESAKKTVDHQMTSILDSVEQIKQLEVDA